MLVFALLASLIVLAFPGGAASETYYVRQAAGSDSNNGRSPSGAWKTLRKLAAKMKAGDTGYVGPGLYRDQIIVRNDGTSEARITFIGDHTGQHTGDPPGTVMITGADPVDESLFVPTETPQVYQLTPDSPVVIRSVVQMDGPQYRYHRARDTREHLVDELTEREVVAKLPSSFFFDGNAGTLYVHTSDGQAPDRHELELITRGNGVAVTAHHYVSVIGFTFRHMGDAGINFFKKSSHGIALGNVSYGNRQGVRVYNATDVLVYGNTFFRNDNSGVYFAAGSTSGVAIANVSYENVKGIRWSSDSSNGIAFDNTLFENSEAGASLEHATPAVLRGNRFVDNGKSQLIVIDTEYTSESNCFDSKPPAFTADFVQLDHYETLKAYQQGKNQDLHSREGGCGALPDKIDVGKLHEDTTAYAERARDRVEQAAP